MSKARESKECLETILTVSVSQNELPTLLLSIFIHLVTKTYTKTKTKTNTNTKLAANGLPPTLLLFISLFTLLIQSNSATPFLSENIHFRQKSHQKLFTAPANSCPTYSCQSSLWVKLPKICPVRVANCQIPTGIPGSDKNMNNLINIPTPFSTPETPVEYNLTNSCVADSHPV